MFADTQFRTQDEATDGVHRSSIFILLALRRPPGAGLHQKMFPNYFRSKRVQVKNCFVSEILVFDALIDGKRHSKKQALN